MARKVLLAIISLIVLPALGLADVPCANSTVATLLSQGPCTIGKLTFDFYLYQGQGTAQYSAASVGFVPLSSGFELTGPFSTTTTTSADESGSLFYNVSATDDTTSVRSGYLYYVERRRRS